jgi:para-nitrobenzyl esterase
VKTSKIAKEDCLFLNIWTPEWPPKSKHAVMFWIHGGGNGGGSSLGGGGIAISREYKRMVYATIVDMEK